LPWPRQEFYRIQPHREYTLRLGQEIFFQATARENTGRQGVIFGEHALGAKGGQEWSPEMLDQFLERSPRTRLATAKAGDD
jgi:hypothetical protein